VATVATFARSLGFGLIESWDDGRFLVEFEPVRSVSLESLVAIWSEPHFEAFHPLHLMAYWLDVPWTYEEGVGPSGPVLHAVSIGLWVLALLVVFRLMRGLGLPQWAALVATLGCGLHPIQVEAVTWATGRKEIVALGLAAASWLLHLRSAGWNDRWSWGSRALYVLAALAKTTVLPLPAAMFLGDVLLREVRWKEALRRQVPTLLVGAGFSAVVMSIWTENEMIRPAPEGFGRVQLVASTYAHYVQTALLPYDDSPIYPVHRSVDDFGPLWWWGVVALGLAAIGLRKRRRALFALGGFVVLLLPVANLVPVYFEVQDRYLSLPTLMLGFGLGVVASHGKRGLALASVLVALLAARTVDYQGRWADDETLWTHATETYPDAYYAWMKLGELRRGRGQWEAAIEAYDGGIAAHPNIRLGHANRLSALAMRDEEEHSLDARALEIAGRYLRSADDPMALRRLAGDMVERGYRDAALVPLGRALDLRPMGSARLRRAAEIQRAQGNDWLADFYDRRARY